MEEQNLEPLRLTKVGEICVYCGQPATTFDHVIPKRITKFFDAGWNLAPACLSCNQAKRDHIKIELIKTPGNDAIEDAAIWAVVYNLLDASLEAKKQLIEQAMKDIGKWDAISRSMAFGALEVFIGKHWCLLWEECQEKCSTGGQLVSLNHRSEVHYAVPDGLKNLLSGSAIA